MGEQVRLGTTTDYYSPQPIDVGHDKVTGEEIYRQRTYAKCSVGKQSNLTLDAALDEVESEKIDYLNKKQPSQAFGCMIQAAGLYGNRDDIGDRKKAYLLLRKIIVLASKDTIERTKKTIAYGVPGGEITTAEFATFDPKFLKDPQVQEAQAKIAIADLVLKQLNDNEVPDVKVVDPKITDATAYAISCCQSARTALNAFKYKDDFNISKSYILEAKLMALSKASDDDVRAKLKSAHIDWNAIKDRVSDDPNVKDESLRPAGMSKDDYIEEIRKGTVYINAWAMVEDAHLTDQKVNVSTEDISAKIGLCSDAHVMLSGKDTDNGIDKAKDYINHDAFLTEANLTAKLARLNINDPDKYRGGLNDARALYKEISEKTAFSDIKAIAIAAKISIDMELGEFTWDDAKSALEAYFDPTTSTFPLKSPFAENSFTYLSMELLEAQLRNTTQRKKVWVPGCGDCTYKTKTEVADYTLAGIRTDNVKKAIKARSVKAVRDPEALNDLNIRASLEHARSTALEGIALRDDIAKRAKFNDDAIKELTDILGPTGLNETTDNILNNLGGKRKMESSFYVTLWGEWANYLEQIAWLDSKDKPGDMNIFKAANDKYDETIKLCGYSKATYDKGVAGQESARKQMIKLSKDNIKNSVENNIEVAALTNPDAQKAITALDGVIKNIGDFKIPSEFKGTQLVKMQAELNRRKLEIRCKEVFYINKQPTSYLYTSSKTNAPISADDKKKDVSADDKIKDVSADDKKKDVSADDKIKELYQQINDLADKTLPYLDTPYYSILNLFGVNSVYMRINKDAAADEIVALYGNYIKGKDFETTYDMIDPLANAALIRTGRIKTAKGADTNLKGEIMDYLTTLLTGSKTTAADKAKAYVWKARMNVWFKDSQDLNQALKDYDEAIKLYGTITDGNKLYGNGASKLAVMEERSFAQFMLVNDTKKGDANAKDRIGQYQQIAKYINDNILKGAATTGLSEEIAKKVDKQDAAAKIKARLTLISMTMGIAEPLKKGLLADPVMVTAVTDICGENITDENKLFVKTEELFNSVTADIKKLGLIDTEMVSLGIDVPTVYARMAENYMILALEAMVPGRDIDDADDLLEDLKDEKASMENTNTSSMPAKRLERFNQNMKAISDAILKVSSALTQVQSKKNIIAQNAQKYIENMNNYLTKAASIAEKDANSLAQAKALLVQAQYAGWTAGSDIDKLKVARGLYEKVISINPVAMDMKAKLDYAGVISIISLRLLKTDKTAAADVANIAISKYKEVKTNDDIALGARACIEMANLQAAFAVEDGTKLREARASVYDALIKLTGSKQDTMGYINLVNGMINLNKPVDKTIIQALCYLGVIEARLYTSKTNLTEPQRLAGYNAIKGIMGGIGTVTGGIYGIIKQQNLEGDASLKVVMKQFMDFKAEVVLAWGDAGGDESTDEYKQASYKTSNYDARVQEAIEKLKKLEDIK